MGFNQSLFKKGNSLDSYKEFEDLLKLYKSSTGYNFNTLNSTKFSAEKANKQLNKDLTYDDKYLKCEVNPKPVALKQFEKKKILGKLCYFLLKIYMLALNMRNIILIIVHYFTE